MKVLWGQKRPQILNVRVFFGPSMRVNIEQITNIDHCRVKLAFLIKTSFFSFKVTQASMLAL